MIDAITNSMTLKQAKAYVNNHLKKGVKCPCCARLAKQYRRKLNSGMAIFLIKLYRFQKNLDFGQAIPTNKIINSTASLDYSMLRFWGLIEEGDGPGWWSLTRIGILFVEGYSQVPKYIHVYNGELVSQTEIDFSDKINISDALGSTFDYRELMED